jgi:hypothetical protein
VEVGATRDESVTPRRTLTPREYDRLIRPSTPWREARRTGYRTDAARHRKVRLKLSAARRSAIARLGGLARTKKKKAKGT